MTPHNKAKKEEIAKKVIMPGDPLRAKYIAENFLDDYKLVNNVRGMYTYTGFYKGEKVTVMPHGMGIASMGIYAHELYEIYDVDTIIRVGSCGAYDEKLELFDIILSEEVYSESNFALSYSNSDCHLVYPDKELNEKIASVANQKELNLIKGTTICSEVFDAYMMDEEKFHQRIPGNLKPLASEMEAFALFHIAKTLSKKAACLMTVVDSKYIVRNATAEEREKNLNKMIGLALDTLVN